MYKMGLIGKNISHSKSKNTYEKILNQEVKYNLFDYNSIEKINLKTLFSKADYISITNPYKRDLIEQVDVVDSCISELGAINCLKLVGDKIIATNTDYQAIKDIFMQYSTDHVVVLGDGAMSMIVQKICSDNDISFEVRSRRNKLVDLAFGNLDSKTLVINACSRDFILNGSEKSNASFWDLNYSHQKNDIIAERVFTRYSDGLSLLEKQAQYALSFWEIEF